MAQTLCAWRSRGTCAATDVTAAQRRLHQRQADVTRDGGARAGRRQEERRTQARTVECTHSFSIRKAPTDRRVLHLTHTHTRHRHRCCCFFGTPGVAAREQRSIFYPSLSTRTFAPLFPFRRPRRRHACLCIFVCVCVMRVKCLYRFRV